MSTNRQNDRHALVAAKDTGKFVQRPFDPIKDRLKNIYSDDELREDGTGVKVPITDPDTETGPTYQPGAEKIGASVLQISTGGYVHSANTVKGQLRELDEEIDLALSSSVGDLDKIAENLGGAGGTSSVTPLLDFENPLGPASKSGASHIGANVLTKNSFGLTHTAINVEDQLVELDDEVDLAYQQVEAIKTAILDNSPLVIDPSFQLPAGYDENTISEVEYTVVLKALNAGVLVSGTAITAVLTTSRQPFGTRTKIINEFPYTFMVYPEEVPLANWPSSGGSILPPTVVYVEVKVTDASGNYSIAKVNRPF